MSFAPQLPTFQKLADTVFEQQQKDAFVGQNIESWERWWEGLKQELGSGTLIAEREARFEHREPEEIRPSLDVHKTMLCNAGFREVDTIWQKMDNRILMAVR